MSYACIKYKVACPRHPLSAAVNAGKIINFTSNYKKNKLYQVRCGSSTCLGKIAYVCDTLEDVQETMSKKRIIVPPNKFVDSASEVEPDSSLKSNIKRPLKDNKSYDKILSEKLNIARQKYDADEQPAKKGKLSIKSIEKVNDFFHQQQKKFYTSLEKAGLQNQEDNRTKEVDRTQQDEVTEQRNMTEQHDITEQHEVAGQHDVTGEDDTVQHADTVQQDTDTEHHNVTEDLNNTGQDDDTEQKDDKRHEDEPGSDESSDKSAYALMKELRSKNKEISGLKEEIEILRLDNIQIKKLNLNLQKILCDEFGVTVSENAENQETPPENGDVHVQISRPVGTLNKKNKTIHLGYNVWIDLEKWSSVLVNSNSSASLFARHAARSVFGEDVLKRSSVTGKTSNRAAVKEARDKLDPTKILAIQSAFEHWSTKELTPPFNSTNMQHFKMLMPTYIGKFCDDLRQPAQNSNKSQKKRVGRSTRKQSKLLERVTAGQTDNETEGETEEETGDAPNVSERGDSTKSVDGKDLTDRKLDAGIASIEEIVNELMKKSKQEEEKVEEVEEESNEEAKSDEKEKSDKKEKSDETEKSHEDTS